MSQCRMEKRNECFICLSAEVPQSRTTRNSKKDNWIRCDCCKEWFHATCGGYTPSQYSKVKPESSWLKCIVCCLQHLYLFDSEESGTCVTNRVTEVAHNRNSEQAYGKRSKRVTCVDRQQTGNTSSVLQQKSSEEASHIAEVLVQSNVATVSDTKGTGVTLDESTHHSGQVRSGEVVSAVQSEEGNNSVDTGRCAEHNKHSIVTVDSDSAASKILIVDNINNPTEFSSSKRILKEVNLFCPEVKVEYAYSLAKGGIAIHTLNSSDRDSLLDNLPKESFGGGVKHPPKSQCSNAVYLKGVDISVDSQVITKHLESLDISISGVRRLLHRYTGRPTKVVRIQCSTSAANQLLSKKVVINGSSCRTERERRVRVIRCFNCQSLGHLAANCKNQKRCEVCSFTHVDDKLCSSDELCVNCGGSHRSSSSKCPVYISRYANLAGKYSESQYIATALTSLPPLSSN